MFTYDDLKHHIDAAFASLNGIITQEVWPSTRHGSEVNRDELFHQIEYSRLSLLKTIETMESIKLKLIDSQAKATPRPQVPPQPTRKHRLGTTYPVTVGED